MTGLTTARRAREAGTLAKQARGLIASPEGIAALQEVARIAVEATGHMMHPQAPICPCSGCPLRRIGPC